MQKTNKNEEKKIEENNSNKMFDTDPLKSERNVKILDEIFNGSKGIEDLWKNIEKNENSTKKKLYDAEKKLLDTVGKLSQALIDIKNNNKKDNTIKDDYNTIIKSIYAQNEGMGTKFIKKFPNWSIQLADIIGRSHHYKRIANATDFKDAKFDDDFKEDLNIKFNRKEKIKPTGLKGKAGSIFSSIGKFFKNFGKNFTGKASKSGVEKKVQAFFKRVNAPWRRWWEFICDGSQELSQKSAKQNLKTILDSNDDQNAKKEILKFFISPNEKTTKLMWEINDKVNNIGFVDDNDKSKINLMFRVFKSLDKKLGTRVEAKFNGEKGAKNLDTNDDKIKRLLELYKIFYTDKKAIKFSEVFGKLGIKKDAKPAENVVIQKVDELFNGSTFSSDTTALDNVKKLAEDARKFLENYYNSDKTKRLLYELKFLGSAFKFSDLNDVTSVDQAINVLDRAPNVLDAIEINDPKVAEQIEEKIANSTKNISSLDDALKNLDNEDFNNTEGQNKLLAALSAIVTKDLIDGVSGGKISLIEFINKLLTIEKYRSIAEKIQNMEIYKKDNNKSLADFIDELKKPLKEAEAKKIKEQNKNIEEIEKLFKSIENEEENYNGGKKALKNPDKGIKIITEIKKLVNYTGTHRTKFLEAVARHIGINDTKIVDKIAKDKPSELAEELKNDRSHLLLQKIRNLIAYGIFGHKSFLLGKDEGSTSNKMPKDLK